jgi:dCMP deaminase
MNEWDIYFKNICDAVSRKSKCLSRQIGVIIVRDNSIVSTGYNGPARNYPHCKPTPTGDIVASISLTNLSEVSKSLNIDKIHTCPRRAKGYKSGEGLMECPAAHAEVNAISNAARLGVSIRGCTMYMNTREIACKDCMTAIVNSGLVELVTLELIPYHNLSLDIARYGRIKLRRFNLL